MTASHRQCSRCARMAEKEAFSRDRTVRDGLQRNCKCCARILKRQYRSTPEGQMQESTYNRTDRRKQMWRDQYRKRKETP